MTPQYDATDTIAAIATPPGASGIAVIKISGSHALDILRSVLTSQTDPGSHPRRMILGTVHDDGRSIDTALACYMKAPSSYTGEDVVEIQCHGGQIISELILELTLTHGARLAEPGEFTRRAFLNGKLDLIQAESVIELISAHNKAYAEKAERILSGDLSKKINSIRLSIESVISDCEAIIEFEDSQDIDRSQTTAIHSGIVSIKNNIHSLLTLYDSTQKLNKGYTIALTGPVNSGKSTLFNTLLGYRRAIVHDHPGTTRDWITEHCTFPAADVTLTDTAGIRATTDSIEEAGIHAARDIIYSADITLHLSDTPDTGTIDISENSNTQHHIYIATKTDTHTNINIPAPWIPISCHTNTGIPELRKTINDTLSQLIQSNPDTPYIVTRRQHTLLDSANTHINQALSVLDNKTLELTAMDLHAALHDIQTLIGLHTQPDILDTLFSRFCIGK